MSVIHLFLFNYQEFFYLNTLFPQQVCIICIGSLYEQFMNVFSERYVRGNKKGSKQTTEISVIYAEI